MPLVSPPPTVAVEPPVVNGTRLTEAFALDVENLRSVLQDILSAETLANLEALAEKQPARLRYPDPLWASTVYQFLLAYRGGVMRREHIVQALAPLYLGRTGSFLRQYATSPEPVVDEALENLCREFERSKPDLVQRWNRV